MYVTKGPGADSQLNELLFRAYETCAYWTPISKQDVVFQIVGPYMWKKYDSLTQLFSMGEEWIWGGPQHSDWNRILYPGSLEFHRTQNFYLCSTQFTFIAAS